MTVVFIDYFSDGLDELTRKQQADHVAVLRVLAKTGRFSIFEATENQTIAKTMDKLFWKELRGYGVLVKRTGGEYPWTTCELTEAGKRLITEAA